MMLTGTTAFMTSLLLSVRSSTAFATSRNSRQLQSFSSSFSSFGKKNNNNALTFFQRRGGGGGSNNNNNIIASSSSSSSAMSSTTTTTNSNNNNNHNNNIWSVEECIKAQREDNNVIFIDGSWHLDKSRNAREEYEAGPRISGSRFFDIDDIASKGKELNPKGLPHMMPPQKLFAAAMDALQISPSNRLIVYGTVGTMMFTPRAFWTIRAMGHPSDRIHLMRGTLQDWIHSGGSIDTNAISSIHSDDLDLTVEPKYGAKDATQIASMNDIWSIVTSSSDSEEEDPMIVDARPAGRFNAEQPEPREGMRGGHMPKSFNVPFMDLLDPSNGFQFRSSSELRTIFADAGIDVNTHRDIICSCGSGVTACVIATALEECGRDPSKTLIYDGSWAEWGSDPDTPIEK